MSGAPRRSLWVLAPALVLLMVFLGAWIVEACVPLPASSSVRCVPTVSRIPCVTAPAPAASACGATSLSALIGLAICTAALSVLAPIGRPRPSAPRGAGPAAAPYSWSWTRVGEALGIGMVALVATFWLGSGFIEGTPTWSAVLLVEFLVVAETLVVSAVVTAWSASIRLPRPLGIRARGGPV